MMTTDPPATSLADEINRLHRTAKFAAQLALDSVHAAGLLLIEAKSHCQHGEWQPWLKANFEGSARTARAYIQVATHWPTIEAKRQNVATLGAALRLLAEPKIVSTPSPYTEEERARLAECERTVEMGLPLVNEILAEVNQCGMCGGQLCCNFASDEGQGCALRLRFAARAANAADYLAEIERLFAINSHRGHHRNLRLQQRNCQRGVSEARP